MSPAEERVASLRRPGVLGLSGVRQLQATLSVKGAAEAFDTWRNQQLTRLVIAALHDLVLSQPIPAAGAGCTPLVQYGVTQGLSLAAQLLQDPTVVFPQLFKGQLAFDERVSEGPPPENFDTPADDVFTEA